MDPGEIILLSSSPGQLMGRLSTRYDLTTSYMQRKLIRASRVDYYTAHSKQEWTDHLGSLRAFGPDAVFINLAAVAGPDPKRSPDVNYRAPTAAAYACQELEFGHFIQGSTQATNAERGGQVPYSRAKAMTDFALSRMKELPTTIVVLGLLYSMRQALFGQDSKGLNMIDLSLLPLTPILGPGTALLQPLEIWDAAIRVAYLAMADPAKRPHQTDICALMGKMQGLNTNCRFYDAVGPRVIDIETMLEDFSKSQGKQYYWPIHIDYRNMEQLLNVTSLGNLNRQFVSLLRSSQTGGTQVVGKPEVWEGLIGEDECTKLIKLDEALKHLGQQRSFPLWQTIKIIFEHPKVILPGLKLSFEILSRVWTHGCQVPEEFTTATTPEDPEQS